MTKRLLSNEEILYLIKPLSISMATRPKHIKAMCIKYVYDHLDANNDNITLEDFDRILLEVTKKYL